MRNGGLRYRYRALKINGAADGVDAGLPSRRCANGGVSSLYRPGRRRSLYRQAAFPTRAACVLQVKEDEQLGLASSPEAHQSVESPPKQFCEAHREEVEFSSGFSGWPGRHPAASLSGDTCQSFKLPGLVCTARSGGWRSGRLSARKPSVRPGAVLPRKYLSARRRISSARSSESGAAANGPAYYCRPPMSLFIDSPRANMQNWWRVAH